MSEPSRFSLHIVWDPADLCASRYLPRTSWHDTLDDARMTMRRWSRLDSFRAAAILQGGVFVENSSGERTAETDPAETLARDLCAATGIDPDADILPFGMKFQMTPRGDQIVSSVPTRKAWTTYAGQARALIEAGWRKVGPS